MALEAILDAIDELNEDVSSHYEQGEDGKYYLKVNKAGNLELVDTKGLRSALEKERRMHAEAQDKFKPFDGLDPEEARRALERVKEFEGIDFDKDKAEALEVLQKQLQEKFDQDRSRLERQLVDKHQNEVNNLSSENKAMHSQLERALITAQAIRAIEKAKGSPELLTPIVERQCRIRKTDGGRHVVDVIGRDGEARISPAAGSTDPMTIEDLISEMKDDPNYARAFDGVGSSGTGATGNVERPTQKGTHVLSMEDATNPAKYRAAKDAAEKAGQELVIEQQPSGGVIAQ